MLPVLLLSFFVHSAHAALYTNLELLPHTDFDFVVIGGGPGGSVVASRLSEDPSVSVLLVEAGPTQDQFEPNVEIPYLSVRLAPNTGLDWNYTTTPQAGLANRSIAYPRGKLLGGSSAINYLVWTRGSADDYDRWANVTGDSGWSWDAIFPFAKKVENLVPPADGHNTTGEIIPKVHGYSGPLGVSVQNWPNHLVPRILETTQELSDEFPYNKDQNSGYPLGIGWSQWSIENGTRTTSATAYLNPFVSRSNLAVLTNTLAAKLIKTGTTSGSLAFRKVQLSSGLSDLSRTVTARHEVIVSAGSVNSPQLLMLSGIGNQKDLESVGVQPQVNLPGVGRNLHDHSLVYLNWEVNATFTQDDITANATLFANTLQQWITQRKGIFTSGISQQIGWLRLPENSTALQTVPDPAAGPDSPHYEILFVDHWTNRVVPAPAEGRYLTIVVALAAPTGRGTVKLNSTNPFDFPIIDPALLATKSDKLIFRDALKETMRIVKAPAWKNYIIGPAGTTGNLTTNKAIDQYIADTAFTVYHPVGTCSMAAWNDTTGLGVVNPDLTVKGTLGLRVVDASVIPYIPGAHTQAPTYIVAERAAKLIKTRYGLA
jgi:choline dehydrogenase-like flavoprotein